MSHKQVKSTKRRLRQLKLWQLLLLLTMMIFVAATFLRLNNIGMIERRDAVTDADKTGKDELVGQRLYDLQRYASSHMNASPGRVALDHAYKRVYDREFKKFSQEVASRSNNDVVVKVRQVCDARAQQQGYGRFSVNADPRYVSCINEEWAKYPAATASSLQFVPPPTAPYYQTFVSPLWSPDFAGWSVVAVVILAAMIITRLLIIIVLRIILWRQQARP